MQNSDSSIRGYFSTLIWLCLLLVICFVIGTLIQVTLRWQSMNQLVESEILSLTLPTIIATNTPLFITSTATPKSRPSATSAARSSATSTATKTVIATVTLFPSASPQRTNVVQSSPTARIIEYSVRSGDTLLYIADQFNVTVPDLLAANPTVNPSLLGIDDVLIIPPQTADSFGALKMEEYTVKAGDSLFQIANQFNLSVDQLYEANPAIKSDPVDIGDVLLIPIIEPLTGVGTMTPINDELRTYLVRRGDTLLGIATQFDISLQELQAANPNLNSSRLNIGDPVVIPEPSEEKE